MTQTSGQDLLAEITEKFGPNAWMVEELLRKYRDDPASVDAAWRPVLAKYAHDTATPPTSPLPTSPSQASPSSPKPAPPAATPPSTPS